MTNVIALTGGIGSGKSTVSGLFEALGVPVIDADKIAKALIEPGTPAYHEVLACFGTVILTPEARINRTLLRELIFKVPTAKAALEQILHPRIHAEIVTQLAQQTAPYCILVIPLLVEHFEQYRDMIDHVIVMDTPIEKQRLWAAQREQCELTHIDNILAEQAAQSDRLKIANTRLVNDSDIATLKKHVEALHQCFLTLQ